MSRALVLALAACGSSAPPPASTPANKPEPVAMEGDECEQLIAKSRSVLEERAQQKLGRAIRADEIELLIKTCREPSGGDGRARLVACVSKATGHDAIRQCWDAPEPDREEVGEAALHLNRLAKHARIYHQSTGAFPKMQAGPTPATTCCPSQCAPTDAWMKTTAWVELEFEVAGPTYYQYAYVSDGTTFHATATGDLDCDGLPGVWTLDIQPDPDLGLHATLKAPSLGAY